METILNLPRDFEIYPIDYIPDYIWEDKDAVWRYALLFEDYYSDRNVEYNLEEMFNTDFLKDKDIAKIFLEYNIFEVLSSIPEEIMTDIDVVCAAIDGIAFQVEQRRNMSWSLQPIDVNEHLQEVLDEIPSEAASNKDFVIAVFDRLIYNDIIESFDVLANWIDPKLRSDKDFIMQWLKESPNNYVDIWECVSDELKADEDFKTLCDEIVNTK